ncbi:hypothetical protein C8R47DRAFT_1329790 [Mycena vitilis]|nr:hypothetical protein C8R47DRAFT_1329790 [Mycena vitilis]
MQFSLITLLAVAATAVVGAPTEPESVSRRSFWTNTWGTVVNATHDVEQDVTKSLTDIEDGTAWKDIKNGAQICGPCMTKLGPAAASCGVAAGTMGDDILQDAQCIYDLGKDSFDFPPECDTCLSAF